MISRIYSHQFLTDDSTWVFGFLDQFKLIEDCGLLSHIEQLIVTAIGNQREIGILRSLLSSYANVTIHPCETDISEQDIASDFASMDNNRASKFISESVTLNRLWNDSKLSDFNALYIHGKGVTAFTRHLKNQDVGTFRNYFYWRKYLEWAVLEHWRDCVQALEAGADIAGCNFNRDPWPHFSGNIWWASSRYIHTLDDNTNSDWWRSVKQHYHTDRLCDEMWPCSRAQRIYNIHSPGPELCSPNPGLYSKAYLRKYYV